MTTQDDGEALKLGRAAQWVFVVAASVLLTVAAWVNVGQSGRIDLLAEELADVRQQAEATQAAVKVDQQYLAVVDVLASKASAHLTPQQIPALATLVVELATIYKSEGITASLILAVMERESNFRPDVVSGRGAIGIMQVIRETAEPHLPKMQLQWSVEVMKNPLTNTGVGVMELVRLHRIYMDEGLEGRDEWHLTLTSYFWGPTNTRRLLESRGEKIRVPSLEYSVGVRGLQNAMKNRGVE